MNEDKFFPLDELNKVLNQIADITPEQKDGLHRIGYDVNELQSELAKFVNAEMRKNLIRQQLVIMPPNVIKATHAMAMALHLDSGPSFRNACYDALAELMPLTTIGNEDITRIVRLTDPTSDD